jgi:hypothetical protein
MAKTTNGGPVRTDIETSRNLLTVGLSSSLASDRLVPTSTRVLTFLQKPLRRAPYDLFILVRQDQTRGPVNLHF